MCIARYVRAEEAQRYRVEPGMFCEYVDRAGVIRTFSFAAGEFPRLKRYMR